MLYVIICNNDNYEQYEIEAENENDAKDLAIQELESERCMTVADTHYNEINIKEIGE